MWTDNGKWKTRKYFYYRYDLAETNGEDETYTYETQIELKSGGNYGYTFRAMPKNKMLLDPENMNIVKWIED